jgi:hypothetical protein
MVHARCPIPGRPKADARRFLALALSFLAASPPAAGCGQAPAPTLGVRNAHAMAYDSDRGRVVLFGGADASTARGDTWEWDGASWTRVALSGPEPRTFPAMAYDSRRKRIVLYGGNRVLFGGDPAANTFLDDTWEWDGHRWTQVDGPGPPPRAEAAVAFDARRGRVTVFGGYRRDHQEIRRLGDTWEWDGIRWAQISVDGPSPRNGAAQVYDRRLGRILLFGGRAEEGTSRETWQWNGASWVENGAESAQGVFNCALAYDSARNRVVRFGGYYGKQRVGDTWEFDGASWKLVSSSGPEPRNHTAMVYDERRKRVVLFGGHDGIHVFGDTWEWDGRRWLQRQAAAPIPHVDNGH